MTTRWLAVLLAGALVIPIAFSLANDRTQASETDDAPVSPTSVTSDQEEDCLQWTPDPDWANAHSSGAAVILRLAGATGETDRIGTIAVNQSGLGSASESDELERYTLEDPTGTFDTLATYQAGTINASAAVHDEPGYGTSLGDSQTLLSNVSVMDGLVEAESLRASTETQAWSSKANWSATGTSFEALSIDGEPVASVEPWQMVDLSDRFGEGSRVMLNERISSVHAPDDPVNDGWAADLTVRAIHVYLHDIDPSQSGAQSLEVVVGQADGHSDFPMQPPCGPTQFVEAEGTVLNLSAPPTQPLIHGQARIPYTGGDEQVGLEGVNVSGTRLATAGATAEGAWEQDRSWSKATSYAGQVCLVAREDGCLVQAEAISSEARAQATAGAPATASGTSQLTAATVAGEAVCTQAPEGTCAPPPNTALEIPGYGTVILNEQVIDTDAADCKASMKVSAIHLVPQDGAELVIGESSAGAVYC